MFFVFQTKVKRKKKEKRHQLWKILQKCYPFNTSKAYETCMLVILPPILKTFQSSDKKNGNKEKWYNDQLIIFCNKAFERQWKL